MNESIFATIKKLIGITLDYTAFDTDILVQIQSAFTTLHQLGFNSYSIDSTTTWGQLGLQPAVVGMVKNYVYLKTKKIFDPPASSFVLQSIEKEIAEYEWRLNVFIDNPEEFEDE